MHHKLKDFLENRGSTHLLRAAVAFIGFVVVALCVFALPAMWHGASAEFPYATWAVFLIVVGLYMTTAPFFFALYEAFKLLRYIDQGKAFSERSIDAVRNIKRCATAIAVLYVGGVPLLFPIAEADDAPGLLVLGAAVACAPVVVAVFAAILQKLLRAAFDLKSDSELTV
jgi:hypothetical protein